MDKYNIPLVKTFEHTKIIGIENIDFGRYVIIDDFVLIYAKKKIKIKNYVHIASFSSITGGGEVLMDDFSVISSGVRILSGTDDFKGRGFGNSSISNKFRNLETGKVTLNKFVIVGANSVILPNVEIGEGASVGAGSVVTKNLKPWGIYVGNKRIGERNRAGILKNHKDFLRLKEKDRAGQLFTTKAAV